MASRSRSLLAPASLLLVLCLAPLSSAQADVVVPEKKIRVVDPPPEENTGDAPKDGGSETGGAAPEEKAPAPVDPAPVQTEAPEETPPTPPPAADAEKPAAQEETSGCRSVDPDWTSALFLALGVAGLAIGRRRR